jgi:hypothetical protein
MTGNGSESNKYYKANFSTSNQSPAASIYCVNYGILHITADEVSSDNSLDIYFNDDPTPVWTSSTYSSNILNFVFQNQTVTGGIPTYTPITIPANTKITLGTGGDYTSFTEFRMWWTAAATPTPTPTKTPTPTPTKTPTPTPTTNALACNDSDCSTACGNDSSTTYYDGGCAPPTGCFGNDVLRTYTINGISRDCCCATT